MDISEAIPGATTIRSPGGSVLAGAFIGQSNIVSRDTAGDKTNPVNTFITNTMNGGTSFVPAVFGTAPLNLGANGVGTSTDPALCCNNVAVQWANAVRASGLYPDDYPIYLIMNATGGQSIAQWVSSGTSSPYWVNLLNSEAALEALHPGFKLAMIHIAQGEADRDGSGTGYDSKAAYLAADDILISQLRGLQSWDEGNTVITRQELGDWGDATQRDRNDAIYSMRSGLRHPFVTTISSAGLEESTDSPQFHFSGNAEVVRGRRIEAARRQMRISGQFDPGAMSDDTYAYPVFNGSVTVGASSTYKVGVADVRGGSFSVNLTGTGSTISLPRPSVVGRVEVTIYTSAESAFTLSALNSTIVNETTSATGSLTVGSNQAVTIWRVTSEPKSERWLLESVYPKVGTSKRYFISASSGARTATLPEVLNSFFVLNGTDLTLPSSGLKAGTSVIAYAASGPSTVVAAGSVAFQFQGGGPTVQSITLNAGEWVELTWASSVYIARLSSRQVTVLAKPSASTLTTAQTGAVVTNEGAAAISVQTLPSAAAGLSYTFVVQDVDGLRVVAASGDTIRIAGSVSVTAGNVQSTTIGNTVTLTAINATEWVATAVNGTWTVT